MKSDHTILEIPIEVSIKNETKKAPVAGFARSFLTSQPIPDAKVTVLENGQELKTDDNGRFGPFEWTIGEKVTLVLEKEGFYPTQTATVTVPPEGLIDPFSEITFQVPSNFAFMLFSMAMGVTVDKEACQIAATITAMNKTMDDIPQGEAEAAAVISPDPGIKPFYFGMFQSGPLKHKTNPLIRSLTSTSDDGGVGFLNVPPRTEPYTLTAIKSGKQFTQTTIFARKGVFINLSPPQGPRVIPMDQENLFKRGLN